MKFQKSVIVAGMIAIILIAGSPSFAEDTSEPEYGWQKELAGNLTATQTRFDNWTQGGENTFVWQFNVNGKAVDKREKSQWDNSIKLSYGRAKLADLDSRKSVDEAKLESVFTYLLGVYVNPYVAASAETQFTPGYNYTEENPAGDEVSAFFDPGYFSQSVGVGYEPAEEFKTRMGFAIRETVTRDHPAPYADDPDTEDEEKIKVEPGLESVTDISKSISTPLIGDVLFTSKLEIFSNFKALNQTDIRWDNIFSAKISRYVDVNFNIKLLYDRDSSVKRQIKQALAVGLTYSFL